MRNRPSPTTDLRLALWVHSLYANCIHAARNLIKARDGYHAVKKSQFEISIVVFRAPLRATSANKVAAFAGCRFTRAPTSPIKRDVSIRTNSLRVW
jgi:hypothetical protein